MYRTSLLLLLLAGLVSLAVGASAPIFCKCTCFTTSHIIPLGPPHESGKQPPPATDKPSDADKDKTPAGSKQSSISERSSVAAGDEAAAEALAALQRRAPASYCAQCNRAFCYEYHLPGCENAEPADFVAMCFQRDSRKDQLIVWGFILGTTSLLGWAAVRKLFELREVKALAAGIPGLRSLAGGAGARVDGLNRGGGRDAAGVQRQHGSGADTVDEPGGGLRGSYARVGEHTDGLGIVGPSAAVPD